MVKPMRMKEWEVIRPPEWTAQPKPARQTAETQRDRTRDSDQINGTSRDKRGNIETSSAGSDPSFWQHQRRNILVSWHTMKNIWSERGGKSAAQGLSAVFDTAAVTYQTQDSKTTDALKTSLSRLGIWRQSLVLKTKRRSRRFYFNLSFSSLRALMTIFYCTFVCIRLLFLMFMFIVKDFVISANGST